MAKANKRESESVDSEQYSDQKAAFFPEAGRGKTLLHIVNLARFNPGIIMLMGEEGSGRTFLLQQLSWRVNQKPGLLAVIDRVVKTKPDLYRAVAESFSLDIVENESIDSLEERVLDYLQGCFVTHRPVILAVDNIQQFSLSMLEELLTLMRRYKKISLLLIGDNNLSAMLKHLDTGKAVRHEVTLQPQNRGEMRQFINWRLPFAIDDHEFEDIVNTTKGNFALLEREVQKKELAYQTRKTGSDNRVVNYLQARKWFLISLFGLVVVMSGVLFYFIHDADVANVMATRPAPQPMPTVVGESAPVAAEDVDKTSSSENEIVDRQLELLTGMPDNVKPDAKEGPISEPAPQVVQKPIAAEIKPVKEVAAVEKPKPIIEPAPVAIVKVSPAVIPAVPAVVEKKEVAKKEVENKAAEPKVAASLEEDDSATLLLMNDRHYSIQLLGGQSKKTIDRFMADHRNLEKLFYFRSERDGKDWYIVTCGEYENRQAAIQAAAALPDDLKKTSPWPRRLSEIHQLINARKPR